VKRAPSPGSGLPALCENIDVGMSTDAPDVGTSNRSHPGWAAIANRGQNAKIKAIKRSRSRIMFLQFVK